MIIAILIVLLFSTLILVHEWGHFVAARKNGIVVEEFGLGFPPRIVGIWKDEKSGTFNVVGPRGPSTKMNADTSSHHPTIYSLNLLPLGGFVKIFGEDGAYQNIKGSFASRGIGARAIVLISGVAMNILFASVLLVILFSTGVPTILNIEDEELLLNQGVSFTNPEVRIIQVEDNSPAKIAGLTQGDLIRTLSAEQIQSGEIKNIQEVQKFISEHAGQEVTFSVMRGKEKLNIRVVPRIIAPDGEGRTGIELARVANVRYSIFDAVTKGIVSTGTIFWAIAVGFAGVLRDLFTTGSSSVEVAGPVGIISLSSQAAKLGLAHFLQFGALISLNLAFINLVPFPALDGGRLLFLLLERIRGVPVSIELEKKIHSAGFLLLIGIILLVTFKDISKFFS